MQTSFVFKIILTRSSELLYLTIPFLGDISVSSTIQAPEAYHCARWMAKLIYSLKIYLFRSQFKLTSKELRGLRQFSQFVVTVYLKAWFTDVSVCFCDSRT